MKQGELVGSELVEALVSFIDKFSIETTPKEGARVANFADQLGKGRWVYIAHVAGTPYSEQIELAARLRREGLEPVLHITARDLASEAALAEVVKSYTGEAGGRQVLLIAGDMPSPAGPFDETIKVLRTGIFERHGIERIGLAGHPEGNKTIGAERLKAALEAKNAYTQQTSAELYLVTQFGFETEPYITWDAELRAEGLNRLPVYVGIPGLASFPTLLRFAAECGVGASMRALKSRAGSLTKLALVAQPDDLVLGIARHRAANPDTLIKAPHFFPFGGLKKTAEWLRAVRERRFTLNAEASGFTVR